MYKENADKMRSAMHQEVDASGYVQGLSAAPAFDWARTAPEGQAFFLLVEAEWKETTRKKAAWDAVPYHCGHNWLRFSAM